MSLIQIDDEGQLFISPIITEWAPLADAGIDTVFDMDGGLDQCIPTAPGACLYVYFPIFDEELPPLSRLEGIASLGAHLIRNGHRVLSHCGLGFNRSALVAARILHELGMPGPTALARIRERRPGALFNEVFAAHVESLQRTMNDER